MGPVRERSIQMLAYRRGAAHPREHMDPSEREFMPQLVRPSNDRREFWMVDGKIRGLARR